MSDHNKTTIISLAAIAVIILGLLYLQTYTIYKLGYQFSPRIIPSQITSNVVAYGDLGGLIAFGATLGAIHLFNKNHMFPIGGGAVALIGGASGADMAVQAFPSNLCMVGVGLLFMAVSLAFLGYLRINFIPMGQLIRKI